MANLLSTVFKRNGNEYIIVKDDMGEYGIVNITQNKMVEPGYNTEAIIEFLIWAVVRVQSKNEKLEHEIDILKHSLRNFEQWHNAI